MTVRHFLILAAAALLVIFIERPKPAGATGDWRFGLIETYESPSDATRLGAAWTRVRFQWAEVQAGGPGAWTSRVTDEQINGEINAGRLVAGMLIGIPDWARDADRLPAGLWLPHNDPGNTWANFVRQAVSRYNGRINHWIIWNEPDVWDLNAPGHTWDGSEEDFFQLLRTAYLVAKETNPTAVIHLAAMTYFWDANYGREQYLNRLLRVIAVDPEAEANNYYFDVLTAHLYFQPQNIFNIIQEFHGIRTANGIPWKPVWLVETNAPPLDDPAWPVPNWTLSVTLYEQAAFVPQALAAALAAGAERVAVYKLKDMPDDRAANPEPFGLVRLDGSRRPAYTTYQVAVQHLSGMTAASRQRWDSVGQIKITQGAQTTTVLFSRLPAAQQALVEATAATATLVDMWGAWQTITASDGYFNIDLPGSSCSQSIGDYCMIGGTTYYLVQSVDGSAPPPPAASDGDDVTPDPFVPTGTPLPTDTPSATATPRPTNTPRATGTATATATPTATATATETPPPTPMPRPDPTAVAIVTPSTGQVDPGGGSGIWLVGGGLALAIFLLAAGWLIRRRQGIDQA
jgi:hypothetical protein